jgi:hypothetical protein
MYTSSDSTHNICACKLRFKNVKHPTLAEASSALVQASLHEVQKKLHMYVFALGLNILCWFGHVQRMEENTIPKRVLYMNFGIKNWRGRQSNR